jgi:hypothetical protein
VDEARAIERSVRHAVIARQGTPDIGGSLGTREAGDYIVGQLRSEYPRRGEPAVPGRG